MSNRELNERGMQALLIRWLLRERNHEFAIPNSNTFFAWEADLISITRAGLAHEFEIKISAADYKRDFEKHKHFYLGNDPLGRKLPSYFWYATTGFEIEPPEYAGWVEVTYDEKHYRYLISERKPAPRLHNNKIGDQAKRLIGHLLSFRLMSEYVADLYKPEKESINE